jgi:hypothetical protein
MAYPTDILYPDYETCKKAKELGFPQTSFFQHLDGYPAPFVYKPLCSEKKLVARPMLQEILDILPTAIKNKTFCLGISKYYLHLAKSGKDAYTLSYIGYNWDDSATLISAHHNNPAQAALDLWIKIQALPHKKLVKKPIKKLVKNRIKKSLK